jgi:photosystem I P700 chlorophyll a apoprotein A1
MKIKYHGIECVPSAIGILYARNYRLVSDQLELGFRYPCDGPGRDGTCQISPWDHIHLA